MKVPELILLITCLLTSLEVHGHVVIIGGGISGLSAANHLCNNGLCDLTIIEAEDRLGGRLFTDDFHGKLIERGAQWIHGKKNNPVYKILSDEVDVVKETYTDGKFSIISSSGKQMSSSTKQQLFREAIFLGDALYDKYEDVSRPYQTLSDKSLYGEAEKIWIGSMRRGDYDADRATKQAVFENTMLEWSIDYGQLTKYTSVLSNLMFTDFDGSDYAIPGGYNSLVDILSRNISTSDIKLNSEVTRVFWKGAHPILNSIMRSHPGGGDNGKILVEYSDENGAKRFIRTDFVIVTISIGVLRKTHEKMFVPNLYSSKCQALKKIGFGAINKIFMYYNTPFWNNLDFSILLLWDTYNETDYGEDFHWFKNIYTIEAISENMLFVWANIYVSNAVSELTDEEIGAKLTTLIRKAMKTSTISPPDDTFMTRWHQEENFLGSYSYIGLREDKFTRNIAKAPLRVNGKPRVLFAGEATHQRRFGTIDGAYRTGVREATRIMEYVRRNE